MTRIAGSVRALTSTIDLPRARAGLSAAENAGRLNALVDELARTSHGFTGGDGWHGAHLADGTSIWSLGDTLIGGVLDDGTRLSNLGRPEQFVRTSVIVDDGRAVHTLVGADDARRVGRGALLEPPGTGSTVVAGVPIPDRWYWPSAVVEAGDGVDLVMQRWANNSGELRWDWLHEGTDVVRLDPRRHAITGVRTINDDTGRIWGAAHLHDGDHTYMYGVTNDPADKRLVIARAARDDIGAPWQYRTSDGWSSSPADSHAGVDGLSNQFTAIRTREGVALLAQDGMDDALTVVRAATPDGPFVRTGERIELPRPIEGTHHYNAVVHPSLSDDDELLVAISRGPSDPLAYESDYRYYLPQFAAVSREALR